MLLSIAGNKDLGITEISDAADLVASNVDPEANIIFGTTVDESLGDQVRITVIATGFQEANSQPSLLGDFRAPAAQESASAAAPAPKPSVSATGSKEFDIPDFLKRGRL